MRYRISKIARIVGVTTEAIRFYEKRESSPPPKMKRTDIAPTTYWISARCCAAGPIHSLDSRFPRLHSSSTTVP